MENKILERIKTALIIKKIDSTEKEYSDIVGFAESILSNKTPKAEQEDLSKCFIFGLTFQNPGEIADQIINSLEDSSNQDTVCSAISMAILTRYAINNSSTGMWGNDLTKVVSVNEYLKRIINAAIEFSTQDIEPSEIFEEKLLGEGDNECEIIGMTLFCCLVGRGNYDLSIAFAKKSNNKQILANVSLLAGIKKSSVASELISKEQIEEIHGLATKIYKYALKDKTEKQNIATIFNLLSEAQLK